MRIRYVLLLLIVATTLEASGDAVIRLGIYKHSGSIRLALFLGGAALLFGYGSILNLAPVEFSRVVGVYIAILFVVWQLINFVAFRTTPALPVMIGGALVTFWRAGQGLSSSRQLPTRGVPQVLSGMLLISCPILPSRCSGQFHLD
jgi:hypothetical protein